MLHAVTQEPGPASVITYPRQLEGVVRKKDDRRKQQREAKAARKSVEAAALAEEVKRLKSHKRREMDEQCAACAVPVLLLRWQVKTGWHFEQASVCLCRTSIYVFHIGILDSRCPYNFKIPFASF